MAELAGRFFDGVKLLLRRWWFIIGCGLLAAGLGLLWSATIAADDGEATARVGFGPDPEFFDILPNIDRITAYVESDDFRTELEASSPADGVAVEPMPPNGILAFLDLEASGAATDAEAVEVANQAATLVAAFMNSLFGETEADARATLGAQLSEIEEALPELQAENDRLAAVQAETVVTRFEDEAAFERFADAEAARNEIRVEIDTLLRQRAEADIDLAELDRIRPDGDFEVLREASLDDVESDRPVWPIAGAVGLVLGALVVLARDRHLLPVRESADLDSLRISADTLLIDGSVRSAALMLRRKAQPGDRVLVAGFGVPSAAVVERMAGILQTLEAPATVVTVDDEADPASDEIALIDGGEVGSSVAEEAARADSAVLLVGGGKVQADELDGPVAELAALGVDLHAVLIVDAASSRNPDT